MAALVDRPYPIDFVGDKGGKAKIDFIWGRDDDPIPVGLRIWLLDYDDQLQLVKERGSWKSFDEAKNHGLQLAVRWVERGNG